MRKPFQIALIPCTLLAVAPVAAQETQEYESNMATMMEAYEKAGMPNEHHEALERMAGTWDVTVKMWMDPSGEPMESKATSTHEMVMDGRFIRYEVEGDFMGDTFRGFGLTGYNNVTGEYEAMWIDNHSSAIYRFAGKMKGDELVMHAEHKDPVTGEMVKSRSVMRFVSDDHIVEEAFETREGKESKTMEIVYHRKM